MTAMQPPRAPTLLDVARAAGVSRTTASNAFNRPDQLSATLRARILETAKRLGYAGPNPVARLLRTGRAGAIGLIAPEPLGYLLTDPAASAFLRGIAQACEPHDTALLILPADARAQVEQQIAAALVDGFVIYCGGPDASLLAALARRGLPAVAVDLDGFTLGPTVSVDDQGGAAAAARHLVELGHRRVAIMSLHTDRDAARAEGRPISSRYKPARDRLRGYFDSLVAGGIAPQRVAVVEEPENDPTAAERVALDLLRRRPRPTAILAMSDILAIGVMRAAHRLGLAVPRDLSVVGFDDIPLARDLTPPLTTVRQPLAEKGRLAAAVLLGAARPPAAPLPTELVVRASTARPPSAAPQDGAGGGDQRGVRRRGAAVR